VPDLHRSDKRLNAARSVFVQWLYAEQAGELGTSTFIDTRELSSALITSLVIDCEKSVQLRYGSSNRFCQQERRYIRREAIVVVLYARA